ncbi:MAG: hypothetical protein U0326_08510 [Polyangiales bacterium]
MNPDETPGPAPDLPAPCPEAEILREAATLDVEEEQWLRDASGRLRKHFREALYGAYAQFEEDDPHARPSRPVGR